MFPLRPGAGISRVTAQPGPYFMVEGRPEGGVLAGRDNTSTLAVKGRVLVIQETTPPELYSLDAR